MIIVSGARRSGTSLAMQVLERSGLSCFVERSELDDALTDRNPYGYRDSSRYVKVNRTLPTGYNAIKLFHFDFGNLSDFQHTAHAYLITLRHPLSSIASTRAMVELTKGKETLSKSIRMYIEAYDYLIEKVVDGGCKYAVVDFLDYPDVAARFRSLAPSVTDAVVRDVWRKDEVKFSGSEALPSSLTSPSDELYRRAVELYESLRAR